MDNGIVVTLVIQSIIFLTGLAKVHQDVQIKLKELEIRLAAVEKQDDEIYAKLDRIMDAIQQIKLELKDKQNKSL